MPKRKELYEFLKHPGHSFHRNKDRKTRLLFSPHGRRNRATNGDWADLECNVLCKIAHLVMEDHPQMRQTCKAWRRELDLCSHRLEPAICDIPRIAQLFPNLRFLDLSGCASLTVRDEALQEMHRLEKLQQLDLKGCAGVSAEGLRALRKCKALESIELGRDPDFNPGVGETSFDSKITDEILEALAECQQLREVRVGYTCRCTVKGVLALTSLKRLECLQVTGHSAADFGKMSSRELAPFGKLQHLRSLSIGVVVAEAFSALSALDKLTSLSLYGDTWERFFLRLEDVANLQGLGELRHLGLHHFEMEGGFEDYAGDSASKHFLHKLDKLESFSFVGCQIAAGCELLLLHCCRRIKDLQIKLAAADDLDNDVEVTSKEMQQQILAVIESHSEWAVERLEVQSPAAVPKFAAAVLSRSPHLRVLKWDCQKSAGEQSMVWHDLELERWKCGRLETMQFGELVRLNPSVLTPMNKFTRLRELCCSMDNALPDSIAFLTGLTALNITWMFGANKGLELICNLSGLQSLQVSCKDPITDQGVAHVRQLTGLSDLVLSSAIREPEVGEEGLQALGQLRGLLKLEVVSATVIPPAALSALSGLTLLRHMEIGSFDFITSDILEALEPLRKLRRLWLRIPKEQMWQHSTDSIKISKEDLAHLAKHHPALSWVCFGNRQMVSLPRATVDRQLLLDLAEAEKSGSLDSLEEPFWMTSDRDSRDSF